jgi:hypothetical protein
MWAPRAGYPQPRAQLNQKLSYLDFMKRLLDAGADPNQRVNKKVWYSNFNFDQSGVDEVGATAFWRAAYGADVDAMKLLVSYGADPAIPTMKPAERPETGDSGRREVRATSGLLPIPTGGPGVPSLLRQAPGTARLRRQFSSALRAACWPRSNLVEELGERQRASEGATPPSTTRVAATRR